MVVKVLIGFVFISFTVFFIYMFLGFAGIDFIEQYILQKPARKTTITQIDPAMYKLESVAKYSILVPNNYKVVQDKVSSAPPFTVLKEASGSGEIEISRSRSLNDVNDLHEYINSYSTPLFNPEYSTINSNQALKTSSPNGIVYTIFVKKESTRYFPWVFFISTSDANLTPDLDKIAKSFNYIP